MQAHFMCLHFLFLRYVDFFGILLSFYQNVLGKRKISLGEGFYCIADRVEKFIIHLLVNIVFAHNFTAFCIM